MFTVVLTGLMSGFALIIAIGAQNAFVLRQGIRGEHIGTLVVVCVACDLVAIVGGVAGLGAVLERYPQVLPIATIGGGIYLLLFGLHAAMRAWKPKHLHVDSEKPSISRHATVMTALALAWLNPHFYLDTVVLLGALGNSFGGQRWWFVLGTMVASVIWFVSLGYGAHQLRGLFARPSAWRVLDSSIAVLMGALGIGLLIS